MEKLRWTGARIFGETEFARKFTSLSKVSISLETTLSRLPTLAYNSSGAIISAKQIHKRWR
jgi:hypothetical protein